jgi:gluconate 2-dehydrogenase gamma chain
MADQIDQNEQKGQDEPQQKPVSRRRFLANTGYVLGGVVLGGVFGGLLKNASKTPAPSQAQAPAAQNFNQALMYFTPEQFKTVEAAVERIYPADDNGPGAKDLGVAFYIDHQLAGDWGFNAREYMQAPFYQGEKVQGYQGRLRRREIFDIALREMQNYSQSKYQKNFSDLTPEQQDEVLGAFEKNQVKVTTISPSGFFNMLRSSTLEGTYADPLYGGNRNMEGWKMRNYPGGGQMSFTQVIDKEFTKIPPKSLQDHLHS